MTADDRSRTALEHARAAIDRARGFSGWTFDVCAKRLDAGPAWDYETMARARARDARRALDMGTGGGEVLSRIAVGLTARFVASEQWEVNAPVAARRLAPLGIDVVRAASLRLPFADGAFDLVLSRHEELDPSDVARVLAPGGCVITQQVGPRNWPELAASFPRKADFGDLYGDYQRGFAAAGLSVVTAETHEERVAFATLAGVAYMLLVTPWTIPDFDPVEEIDALLSLEDACGTADGIVLTEGRFLIAAEKRT